MRGMLWTAIALGVQVIIVVRLIKPWLMRVACELLNLAALLSISLNQRWR